MTTTPPPSMIEKMARAMFVLLEQRNYHVATDSFTPATWKTTDELTRGIYLMRARAGMLAIADYLAAFPHEGWASDEDVASAEWAAGFLRSAALEGK